MKILKYFSLLSILLAFASAESFSFWKPELRYVYEISYFGEGFPGFEERNDLDDGPILENYPTPRVSYGLGMETRKGHRVDLFYQDIELGDWLYPVGAETNNFEPFILLPGIMLSYKLPGKVRGRYTQHLRLGGGISYIYAEYRTVSASEPQTVEFRETWSGIVTYAGYELSYRPRVLGAFGAFIDFILYEPEGAGLTLAPSVGLKFTGILSFTDKREFYNERKDIGLIEEEEEKGEEIPRPQAKTLENDESEGEAVESQPEEPGATVDEDASEEPDTSSKEEDEADEGSPDDE